MASASDTRRYETQKHQREARETGIPSPRWLARSVEKAHCRGNKVAESYCGAYFRSIFKELPRKGRKYLHPERHIRKINKV